MRKINLINIGTRVKLTNNKEYVIIEKAGFVEFGSIGIGLVKCNSKNP